MINQLLIAIFGLTSIYFAMGKNPTMRKYAPIIGLAGQPFWFAAVIPTKQYGMVILCTAYTAVYLHAIWVNWGYGLKKKKSCPELSLLPLTTANEPISKYANKYAKTETN